MGRVYIEDITSIALLYNYEATSSISMMLPHDMIKEYAKIVELNLDEMESNFNGVYSLDNEVLIYFNTQDENGKWYSVLKSDIDIKKARYDYGYIRSYDLITASRMANALEVLDIELVGERMKRIEHKKPKKLSLVLPKTKGKE